MHDDSLTDALSLFLPSSVAVLVAPFLSFIPTRVAATLCLLSSVLIAGCNILRIWWTPPTPGTRAARIYAVVTFIAAKKGFNAGAYGPGYKSLAIPSDADRQAIANAAGIPAKNPKNIEK